MSLAEQKHPITKYVFGPNYAPWTWRWLIDLADAVQLVLNQVNGIKIINKLKNESTFDEALFQLYIAKCIVDGNFKIEFIEENNKTKIVDWKITDSTTKDELLVELTELRTESADEVSLRKKFRMISNRIKKNSNLTPVLFFRGMLFKPYISRPTLQHIFEQIDSTATRARKDRFAELIEKNTISLALATVDEKHRLIDWAIQNNVMSETETDRECSDSSFKGFKYEVEEVGRIIRKIEDKKRQLNRKALNGLVIRSNRLFMTDQIERSIDILKEVIYDHEYLATLIVVGGHVGGLDINSRIESDTQLYLIKSADVISKEILILTNTHSMNHVKTLNFTSKIKNAFESCNTLLF